mgnify:CR=1 FL=1
MTQAFGEQLQYLPDYLGGHLRLVISALFLGSLVSIPLGIIATQHVRLEKTVLGVAGVIQTIPGLALLAIMVPLLNMIGIIPALIALTLYSILPILRNTVVGIREIDASIIEAGRGIGMTKTQLLYLVQLPLSLPVIIAGLRTSAVWVVGIATLSTPVGATSLGNYIFSGLQTRNNMAIFLGCLAAAVLALVLDNIIHGFESGIRRRDKTRIGWASTGFVGILLLTLFLGAGSQRLSAEQPAVVHIGNKPFTEQYILSEFLAQFIIDSTEYEPKKIQNLGSTVAFDALRKNQIDVYVDYSGTLWNMYMPDEELPKDSHKVLDDLAAFLHREYGVQIAASLGFENAYCLAMKSNTATGMGIESISDLTRYDKDLILGSDVEFFGRPEWTELQEVYSLEFKTTRSMDAVLMYSAIQEDQVDVISAYTTDGRISAYNLSILEDPEKVFPPYDAVVLLSPEMQADTQFVTMMQKLEHIIDAETMRSMNMRVDQEGESPEQTGRMLYQSAFPTKIE